MPVLTISLFKSHIIASDVVVTTNTIYQNLSWILLNVQVVKISVADSCNIETTEQLSIIIDEFNKDSIHIYHQTPF